MDRAAHWAHRAGKVAKGPRKGHLGFGAKESPPRILLVMVLVSHQMLRFRKSFAGTSSVSLYPQCDTDAFLSCPPPPSVGSVVSKQFY